MHQMENQEEDDEIVLPRYSFKKNVSLGLPRPSCVIESLSRKRFSYNKLPQEPLTLTVLKLDGSSFVIVVPQMGTVTQLKQGVEAAFSHLPKRGPGMVLWSHVWRHFCLCYDGQKLLIDTDCIGCYGIRDGDTLRFARHVSVTCNVVEEGIEKDPGFVEPTISESSVDSARFFKEGVTHHGKDNEKQQDVKDNEEDMGVVTYCKTKLAYLMRGWISYQRLASPGAIMKQKTVASGLSFSVTRSIKNARQLSRGA